MSVFASAEDDHGGDFRRSAVATPLAFLVFWLCWAAAGAIAQEPAAPSIALKSIALKWGGDQEGGGPYIYPDDSDPNRLVGFEVDLANALGRRLGRKPEFVQSNWDQLLPELDRRDIDLVLNGYEYSPERAAHYLASIPYYIYELGLCARKDDATLEHWADLARPDSHGQKRRVGVLSGSAADRYVTEKYGETCRILRYEGSTEALRLVASRQIDATVQDMPILQFYVQHLQRYPRIRVVDKPAASGFYVAYARPEDRELIEGVNQAFRELYRNGELKTIYERYGIWNARQEELPSDWETWDQFTKVPAQKKWLLLWRQFPLLLRGARTTVLLAVLSMPLAILIGLTVALARSWNSTALGGSGVATSLSSRLLTAPFTLYVEFVRGTPLAFQLFVVYYVLPQVGLRIDAFWAGVLALAVNYSAYEAEIFRLGLQVIPRGQLEAALALGMSRGLAVRRILLPQVVRVVIPATANDFIALFKDTAVCSVIAVEELSKRYAMGAKSTDLFLEMAVMASILYLLMSYPLSLLSAWLERRLKREAQT